MDTFWHVSFGFVTLLVIPFLGIVGVLKRRASLVLLVLVGTWALAGLVALALPWHPGVSREQFLKSWLTGLALGAGFLAVDWLRRRRRVSRLLKLMVLVTTVVVFGKALHDFLQRYV